MKSSNKINNKPMNIIIGVFLLLLDAVMLYPIIYVFSVSISDTFRVIAGDVVLFPKGFSLESYKIILNDTYFTRSYLNTVIYSVLGTFITLMLVTLTAYPLSIRKFRSKKYITYIHVFTMFFGGGMIPTYLVIKSLGLIDTIWAMVLPNAIGVWYLLIFRSFFSDISYSLHESAYIDGANDWIILYKIIIPLSKPVIATISLFTIVAIWNDFFSALLYLNDRNKHPLQMTLRRILLASQVTRKENFQAEDLTKTVSLTMKSAAIFITILPIILIYPFIQKHFVKGVMIGSIKG
ncbi:MAG TPA: carbohydrate ABC transporter permease [Clostridiales bacterium]|nr:carbohydrate ABC transporter permease [Clostridiales bacterium]